LFLSSSAQVTDSTSGPQDKQENKQRNIIKKVEKDNKKIANLDRKSASKKEFGKMYQLSCLFFLLLLLCFFRGVK
jgi:hypothetical protein